MEIGFSTKFINSFYLWLDHTILNVGHGYCNTSSLFYPTSDYRFNLSSFSSPYKQFVWDHSVAGAIIPSGISGSNGFIPRGTSGCMIDFLNGRVLLNAGINGSFSGSYSIKDFNIYINNDAEENIVFNDKKLFNPLIGRSYSGISPYDNVLPGIFINIPNYTNEPFALGGEDQTKLSVRLSVISNNFSKTNDLLSLLADRTQTLFPILELADVPLNIYGDYKTGLYNYITTRNNAVNNNALLVRIDHVANSWMMDKTIRNRNEIVAFVEMDMTCLRYPRQYY